MKIGIISAEPSGDLLGSKLLSVLQQKFDDIKVVGVGSGPLSNYGLSSERSLLEIMGLVDPILNYSKITNFRKKLIKDFIKEEIDIFIGIDAPDFNFEIHKQMQKEGIKTIHVVCPSVWAWRPGRVKHFKHVDYMLCLFPFELEYCANVRKQAFCIGHPLIDEKEAYENEFKEDVVCIMPGSRKSEIKNNLDVMIDGFNQFNFEVGPKDNYRKAYSFRLYKFLYKVIGKEKEYTLARQKIEFALESFYRSASSLVFQLNKRHITRHMSIFRCIDRRFETGEIFVKWDEASDDEWLLLIYIKNLSLIHI